MLVSALGLIAVVVIAREEWILEEKAERRQFEIAAHGAWRSSSGISLTHQVQLFRSEVKSGIYKIAPGTTLGVGEVRTVSLPRRRHGSLRLRFQRRRRTWQLIGFLASICGSSSIPNS